MGARSSISERIGPKLTHLKRKIGSWVLLNPINPSNVNVRMKFRLIKGIYVLVCFITHFSRVNLRVQYPMGTNITNFVSEYNSWLDKDSTTISLSPLRSHFFFAYIRRSGLMSNSQLSLGRYLQDLITHY